MYLSIIEHVIHKQKRLLNRLVNAGINHTKYQIHPGLPHIVGGPLCAEMLYILDGHTVGLCMSSSLRLTTRYASHLTLDEATASAGLAKRLQRPRAAD